MLQCNVAAVVARFERSPRAAELTPVAFVQPRPDPVSQTWWLAVQQEGVVWRREGASLIFDAAPWAASLQAGAA